MSYKGYYSDSAPNWAVTKQLQKKQRESDRHQRARVNTSLDREIQEIRDRMEARGNPSWLYERCTAITKKNERCKRKGGRWSDDSNPTLCTQHKS